MPPVVARPNACDFAIELAPEQPWLGARGSAVRIDLNALHRGEIDDKAIVADGTPGDIVPAAADRKRQSLPACELDAGDDVSRPDAVHGEGRTAVFIAGATSVCVGSMVDLRTITAVWVGDMELGSAIASGSLEVHGPQQLRAKLGSWLALSPFATVKDQRALTSAEVVSTSVARTPARR